MKKAQRTDLIRAIRKSKGRFLSLLFIVALGTAFFTGVRSAEPDMIASADKYYDESNLMDVRILGTLGLTEDDVAAIADTEGITAAEGGYSTEVLAVLEDSTLVMNVMSPSESMNQMTIWEGRMPESSDECFMDAGLMIAKGYEIGDTITLTDEKGSAPAQLVHDSYTIVGSGTWSWYLSWSRGSASIGDGSLDAFMVVPEEAFDMDYYTVVYAMVSGVKELNTFSDAYDEAVKLVTDRIEEIAGDRCEIRYSEVYEDAQKTLQDAREALSEGEKELEDAEKKLLDAEEEYSEGLKTYEDSVKAYEDGMKAYEEGKNSLAQAKAELDQGKADYQAGLKAYEDAQQTLEAGRSELSARREELNNMSAQVEEGYENLSAAELQLSRAQSKYEQQKRDYEASKAEYDAGMDSYRENKAQLDAQKEQLDAGWDQVAEAQAQLDQLQAQMDQVAEEEGTSSETYQQLQAEWTELNSQVEAQQQELNAAQAEYDAAAEELAAAKAELDTAKAQLDDAAAQLDAANRELTETSAELSAQKAQLDEAERQITEGWAAIAAVREELDTGEEQLREQKALLDQAEKSILEGEQAYNAGIQTLRTSEQQLQNAQKQLKEGQIELQEARQELDDGWLEYKNAARDADEQLEEARQEIADGEKQLTELEEGKWYVLGRDSVQTSVEFSLDAERIGAIGKVFPVIFFLVAARVSLTTMTRMIEEERTLIGTMKALGYSKLSIASKYILYALSATLIGGVIGVIVGSKLLPYVIMLAYSMLYSNIQYTVMPLHFGLCVSAIGLAVLCTVGAAFLACYKEMLSTPASLMRPPAPKQGKRVFLERLPFIWNRMNFSMKSTIRNLVRYKKRFFMTVFGIGGCMAILLASFGLRDSISVIAENQYRNIWTYSAACGIDEDAAPEEQRAFVEQVVVEQEGIGSGMLARLVSLDVYTEQAEKMVNLYVVDDTEQMNLYLDMHDRVTQEPYQLTDEGVILTEKLANTLGVQVGDRFTLKFSSTKHVDAVVTALTENYMNHCVYMTKGLYETLYGQAPEYNQLLLKFTDGADQQLLAESLLGEELVISVSLVEELQDALNDMIGALNLVVWVLIAAAGLLVFVVLFNLNNINISERRRELASLKVLGFFNMDVAMYVYRENIFLTIFGILLGLFLGTWLHQYLITTLEVELIMFGREINSISYLYSTLFTIAFAVLVNIGMYKKLKQIDMIESLKSVE